MLVSKAVLFFSLITVVFMAMSCGKEESKSEPAPPPPPPSAEWVVLSAVLDRNCGRCHNIGDGKSAWKESGAAFLASPAQKRVRGGSMPPAGTPEARNISSADINLILSFKAG